MNQKKIRYGIIGVGYLGKFHLKHLLDLKYVNLVGLYDSCIDTANKISTEYNVQQFESMETLLDQVDAVSIVTPTITHKQISLLSLKYNCNIFIEKPIADNVKDAKTILNEVINNNSIAQVGHIERFNPAFQEYIKEKHSPLFLECHRLSKFNKRSMDISVVLDLMIHDIDLILHVVDSPIKEIIADGINVISNSIDLANVKLIFENGCVANLTASRISNKDMRKMRVFEKNSYTNIDLLQKSLTKYYTNSISQNGEFNFQIEKVKLQEYDALKKELEYFCESIISNQKNFNNILNAVEALKIAEEINKIITSKIKS